MRRLAIALAPLVILALVIGAIGCGGDEGAGSLPGRGPAQVYDTDHEVIQRATSTFYSDVHAGFDSASNTWKNTEQVSGHYYPTKLGEVSAHYLQLSTTIYDPERPNNYRIDGASGAATTAEIQNHAIWMGLLVNAPGDYTGPGTGDDRGAVTPLAGENGPYLQEIPQAAMAGNAYNGGPEPGGSYCWVVGLNGRVFGAYKADDGFWYAGDKGVYP